MFTSSARSSAGAECVSAPEEIMSTPVSAICATVSSVTPPEASVNLLADGKAIATAQSGKQIDFQRDGAVKYEVEASARGYTSQRVELKLSGAKAEALDLKLAPDGSIAAVVPTGGTPPMANPVCSRTNAACWARSRSSRSWESATRSRCCHYFSLSFFGRPYGLLSLGSHSGLTSS